MNSPRQCWLPLAVAWAWCFWQGPVGAQTLTGQGATDHIDIQIASEWSQGRYGDTTHTRIQQTSLTTRYRAESWQFDVEIPWLRVTNPADPTMPPSNVGSANGNASGLGDIWLKLSWEMQTLSGQAPGLDLVLKHKSDTGDLDRGLGTGGRDWALQANVSALLARGHMLFGHVGHRRTGDVAGHKPYGNPWYGEIGIQGQATSRTHLGTYYTTRQAIGALGPVKELTTYCSWGDASTRMQAYATHGMAKASPDWAAGLIARQRF